MLEAIEVYETRPEPPRVCVGLQALAERAREVDAADLLVEIITHAHAIGVFSHEGQAADLVAAMCDGYDAGLYSSLRFDDAPAEDAGGLRFWQWSQLRAVDLASLLCLLVVCCRQRRYLGPTQMRLLARDCERSIELARQGIDTESGDHNAA